MPALATRPQGPGTGAYLDSLQLSNAVIGDRIVLEERGRGQLVLHRVSGCRAHTVGRFADVAAAWAALDLLDVLSPRG